jgi:diguanylate cyclase (GGDEF)-like protein/hemerythrin-like metal-binding protein
VNAHRNRVAEMLLAAQRGPALCVAEVPRHDGRSIEVELHVREEIARGEKLVAIFAQDITDRFRTAAGLNLLVFSDPLTGLVNRALFADRLRQAALDARRDCRDFGLVKLDLDGFKAINDCHGHAIGDAVLQQVAQRMQACLRAGATVARLGGDAFAVLLVRLKQHADASAIVERLLDTIRQPIMLRDIRVTLSASAGIAVFPEHGNTVEHLLIAADTALYMAKHEGGGRYGWAGEGMAAGAAPLTIMWSVAHEVGVAEMDGQHARLAELLNQLAVALHNGQNHKAAFGEFVRFAAFHFAAEERLMALSHYPDAAVHSDLHKRLLADVSGLALEGEGVSASLILRYLQEWLFRHIDGADRALAAVLLAGP